MKTSIASLDLVAVRAGEPPFDIKIEIGAPRPRGSDDLWECPIRLDGLHETLPPICGGDSFLALCLAIGFVQTMLRSFQEEGGTLHYAFTDDEPLPEGSTFPLEAYSRFSMRD